MRTKECIIKYCIGAALSALFLGYYASITLFPHAHIIDGGTIIIHSHIHNKSHQQTPDGSHTKENITLIAQLSLLEFLSCTAAWEVVPPPQIYVNRDTPIEQTSFPTASHLENIPARAPPVVC